MWFYLSVKLCLLFYLFSSVFIGSLEMCLSSSRLVDCVREFLLAFVWAQGRVRVCVSRL